MSEYAVSVENLTKRFNGKVVVNHLSLKIKKGEIFGFLGPNGSGKTTTIRMLCGLMAPDAGHGYCMGQDINATTPAMKKLVGYLPQTFSLYRDLTVRENLEFIAKVYEEPDYPQCVNRIIRELHLKPYEKILAGRLSGGWQHRLSLAAALIHRPQLLLLDEPTAGVDPKARREFWDYIVHLSTEGMTALVSTHYMDEAERCNRLAFIIYGELMAEGTLEDIAAKTNLISYVAQGEHLTRIREQLIQENLFEQVTIFGNVLRVTTQDKHALVYLNKKYPHLSWQQQPAMLEEIFVYLVGKQERV